MTTQAAGKLAIAVALVVVFFGSLIFAFVLTSRAADCDP